ncbi:MAG: type I-C CRISPR-associated endonuclease Cas1c [Bacilli bacterium]
MKQLLNTLYVTHSDSYISKDGNNLLISIDGKEVGRVPVHNIQQIVCFGYSGVSPYAMRLCIENNVTISFMTSNGKFLASVYGETKGNVLLRREQYRIADDLDSSLRISRHMITGKILNSLGLLKKGKNNHKDKIDVNVVNRTITKLNELITEIDSVSDMDALRGLEGEAAKAYFNAFDSMILQNKTDFFFRCRNRRPPRDRTNAILSFLYSMLANDVKSALESIGLDSYVGFLHTDRPGRPSLALDVMEEMRPLADRLTLNLINLRIVQPEGFIEKENGAIIMNDDTRKIVIDAWQSRKTEIVYHPYLKEKLSVGLIPFVQAMLLSRHIRGEINGYPPFILKQGYNDAIDNI